MRILAGFVGSSKVNHSEIMVKKLPVFSDFVLQTLFGDHSNTELY